MREGIQEHELVSLFLCNILFMLILEWVINLRSVRNINEIKQVNYRT